MAQHHYTEHRPTGPRAGTSCPDCSTTAPRVAPPGVEFRVIIARDGTVGQASGSLHHCQMEGCNGLRISVRWPDGRTTFPCSRGLMPAGRPGEYRII